MSHPARGPQAAARAWTRAVAAAAPDFAVTDSGVPGRLEVRKGVAMPGGRAWLRIPAAGWCNLVTPGDEERPDRNACRWRQVHGRCGPDAGRCSCSGWRATSRTTGRCPPRATTCGVRSAARSRARWKPRPCGSRRLRSSLATTVRRPRSSGVPAAEGTVRSGPVKCSPMTRSWPAGTGGSAGTAGKPRVLWRP
jgi:hypothetical protein